VVERFRALFDQLPEALLILSPTGVVTDANLAAADLYRCEPSELIGRRLAELSDGREEAPAAGKAPVEAAEMDAGSTEMDAGSTQVLVGSGRRSDGTSFPHELVISRDQAARGGQTFVMVRDLSERQRLERGLAGLADLARLQGAEGSLHAVAARAVQLTCRMLDADRAALCAFEGDATVEWLANHRLERLIAASSDLRPSQIPWLTRALETGRPELIDRRRPEHQRSPLSEAADQLGVAAFAIVPLRSGEELTGALGLIWSGDPPELARQPELLVAIGRLVGLALGNIRLRDSLLARQHALDESETRYRNLFQEAPEPILISDWDGRITDANQAAMKLYGRSRQDLLSRGLEDIADMPRDERRELMSQLRRVRRGVATGRGRRADGSTFPQQLEIAVTTVRGEERLLVQGHDLTEQERMQAELLQAQKMEALGQLVSGVAHELNNPLSAIVAFSQLLRTDERLPADMARDAELLMQEADRTRRIVQNLLEFARQRAPVRQQQSVKALVGRSLELHAYALRRGRIVVRQQIPDDLPPVDVDPGQIQQVLLNLISNAIQAIGAVAREGTLTVSAERIRDAQADGDSVRLRIHDDGPGVSAKIEPRLFEPFFTTRDVGEGTGLGLSVSYGIVASHGGRLWYEPTAGPGATFVLDLPAARTVDLAAQTPAEPEPIELHRGVAVTPTPAAGTPAAGTSAAGTSAAGRILAVDDEPAMRIILERGLGRAGYEVSVAASGAEALEMLSDRDFDLMLIDHRMSGMDGTETYRRVVDLRPEMAGRAVIMSGDTHNPALRVFAAETGLRMLDKPFDVTTLVALLEEILGSAGGVPSEAAGGARSVAQPRG
jgi:PAS domain S-box-containing protein